MSTVLMTGGHAGLGLVGAQTLAKRFRCNLILAGRNPQRVEDTAQRLRSETGIKAHALALDLNSLASVRSAAVECREILKLKSLADTELDGIVCNAGAQFKGPPTYSMDGYEETFAGNCLGHFLLVNLLIDSMSASGRIVWTTSGTHDPATLDGKSVGKAVEPDAKALARQGRDGEPISAGQRYSTSKLCTILYAYELHRRLRRAGSSIASIAYDPGFIPEVGMGRQAPGIFRNSAVKFLLGKLGMTMGTMPLSGEALATLTEDPKHARDSGKYFHSKKGVLSEARSSAASYDEETATRLWVASEMLVGLGRDERPRRLVEGCEGGAGSARERAG